MNELLRKCKFFWRGLILFSYLALSASALILQRVPSIHVRASVSAIAMNLREVTYKLATNFVSDQLQCQAGARTLYHRPLYHRTLYHGHFTTRPLYHAATLPRGHFTTRTLYHADTLPRGHLRTRSLYHRTFEHKTR